METTTMTPEVREEMIALVRQELEQQMAMRRENRSVYRSICKDFEAEMRRYDRENDVDGRTWGYKVQDGIGTLLRTMYHVKYAVHLPATAEPEMRAFVQGVLGLMERYSPKDEET